MMLFSASIFGMYSCSSDDEGAIVPQEVAFTLDYKFIESGSMTRGTGDDAYKDLYENYIKTKVLTPKTYNLTFKNSKNQTVATMNGYWDNKDLVRLMEGEYTVTGTSQPDKSVSDTVSLSFNQKVMITKDMNHINLTANYDSYLLMVDKGNYKQAYYYGDGGGSSSVNFKETEYVYSLFIQAYPWVNNYLRLTCNDGKTISIDLETIPFEKGKYYYFNDMTSSFDIPEMESGN